MVSRSTRRRDRNTKQTGSGRSGAGADGLDGRRRTVSRRDTEDNIAITIERSWGGEVSAPLRERIAADAELIGDDQAAVTLNTGAILEELGGVEVVGFGAAVAHTRDLFVMLETDRLTATEVGARAPPAACQLGRSDCTGGHR